MKEGCLKVLYYNSKIRNICTNKKSSIKHFGGKSILQVSLFSRINALKNAETLHDIIVQPHFGFHVLDSRKGGKYKNQFAINVKTHHDSWRLIIHLLDNNEKPLKDCKIDEIAKIVKIIEIIEVSKHYE